MPSAKPAHANVYARLGASRLAGVGVFAIVDIPAGTDVFANDRAEIRWIAAADLDVAALSEEQMRLYRDFAIRQGDLLGCPANFNLLTVGWDVNQPAKRQEPNLAATADFALIARRDIFPGEELTVRYATFSDPGVAGWLRAVRT
jgi:hypothetical protein